MTFSTVLHDPFVFALPLVSKLQGCCHVCEDILLTSLLSILANFDGPDQNPFKYGAFAWHHLLVIPCALWGAKQNDDEEISTSTHRSDSFHIWATETCCKYYSV